MTREQYERWKDFSVRMAGTCFYGHRRPTSTWIIDKVEEWFWWRDYKKDWDKYSSWDGCADSYSLSSHVDDFYDDLGVSVQCKACRHDDCRTRYPHYEDSCPMCEMECRCDEVEELANNQFEDQWLGPIRCCIRAGIDMACEPSAGVVGFTAGDIRRMYPEGVPDWVFPKGERLYYWLTDKQNGTFDELPDDAGLVL